MKTKVKTDQLEELDRDEGLAMLMPDIQLTAMLVCEATDRLMGSELFGVQETYLERPQFVSIEERYLKIMKKMQFGEF